MKSVLSLATVLLSISTVFAAPTNPYGGGEQSGMEGGKGYGGGERMEEAKGMGMEMETTSAAMAMESSSAEMKMAEETSSAENAYETSSAAYVYETSSAAAEYTSSATEEAKMMETTTSEAVYETSSTEEAKAMETTSVAYGSGSSNWNSGGYNNCVQQCMAQFGNPMGEYTPSGTEGAKESGSAEGEGGGNGATHTVIVAPTQGVLRYVPFAVNASVGDTIKFMWNANVHTVTKGSQLELCNKTSDKPFTSGVQNQSFVFTQVVNDTSPTFFYCNVPTHCQKGMFGILNPPNAAGAASAASSMMSEMAKNDSNVAAWAAYANNMTSGSDKAAGWGATMDMSAVPEWAQADMAANIMYTRTFLAANPEVMSEDGSINLGGDAPLKVPQDLSAALNSDSGSTGTGSGSTPQPSASAGGGSTVGAAATGGARGLGASSVLAVAVAFGTALFAL